MILLGEEVVTGFLHHPGDAQAIHLCHGEHLDAKVLQDVTGGKTDNDKKLTEPWLMTVITVDFECIVKVFSNVTILLLTALGPKQT